jgi:nicotinate-nucleotide adenylyltransferase
MNTASSALPLIALLGGSFNPPHAGHFRIAIEAAEALSPVMTLFIPCASPPHKSADNLLPFDLRVSMLRAALAEAGMDKSFAVCEVENERSGPSYTVDTRAARALRYPDKRLVFIMGNEDYAQLSTWRQWRELPALADLMVLPRRGKEKEFFDETTHALWPEAQKLQSPFPAVPAAYALPGKGRVFFLPQPLPGISSTMVRERWLQGRRLDFLVPRAVHILLDKQKRTIRDQWKSISRCAVSP